MNPWTLLGWIVVGWIAAPTLVVVLVVASAIVKAVRVWCFVTRRKLELRRQLKETIRESHIS